MTLFDTIFRGLTGSDKPNHPPKGYKRALSDTASDRPPIARQTSPDPLRPDAPIYEPTESMRRRFIEESVEGDIELPVIMSPLRTASGSHSTKVYETSVSTADTSASLSTPGADISLGPQPIPFMLRKRLIPLDTDSPLKNPNNTPTSLYHREVGKAAITIRHPDESVEEVEKVIVEHEPVSQWRKDQLKYVRKGRMSNNPELKRVPILHGPLSLPYARNPSGVDATAPDDGSYLPPVKRNVKQALLPPAIIYEPADRHVKSTSDDTRSAGKQSSVPLGMGHPKNRAVEIKAPADRAQGSKPPVSATTASTILRAPGWKSDEVTLPRTSHIQLPPSTDPFDILIEAAIANATRHRDPSPRAFELEQQRIRQAARRIEQSRTGIPSRNSYSNLMALWNASNSIFADLPDDEPAPQERAHSDDITGHNTFTSAVYSTPIKISPPGNALLSKADKSENWRQKFQETPGGSDIPMISGPSSDALDGKEVMTIDALFEKFDMTEENKENAPKATNANSTTKGDLAALSSKSSEAAARSALADARHAGSNLAPRASGSTRTVRVRKKAQGGTKAVTAKEKEKNKN